MIMIMIMIMATMMLMALMTMTFPVHSAPFLILFRKPSFSIYQ